MRKHLFHSVLAVAIVVAGHVSRAAADPIIIGSAGTAGTADVFPFGAPFGHVSTYFGEYQQVYLSSKFGGPGLIDQVAFESAAESSGHAVSDTFTLSLGTTSASPDRPGTSYPANRGPNFTSVFAGTVSATLAGGAGFDFVINLSSPFLYDPSQGNLLLDVNLTHSAPGPFSPFEAGSSPDTGELFNVGGTGDIRAAPDFGLLTRFDVAPAATPEPATLALLGLGLGASGLIARRRGQART